MDIVELHKRLVDFEKQLEAFNFYSVKCHASLNWVGYELYIQMIVRDAAPGDPGEKELAFAKTYSYSGPIDTADALLRKIAIAIEGLPTPEERAREFTVKAITQAADKLPKHCTAAVRHAAEALKQDLLAQAKRISESALMTPEPAYKLSDDDIPF